MRHLKLIEDLIDAVEDFGYALGDVQDYLDREEPRFIDLINKVGFGRTSSRDAAFVIALVFAGATNSVREWRDLHKRLPLNAGTIEFGRAIDAAQQAIDYAEPMFIDLVTRVGDESLTRLEATRLARQQFAAWRIAVEKKRTRRAEIAVQGRFPYLHESLRVGRVVVPLPIGDGAA